MRTRAVILATTVAGVATGMLSLADRKEPRSDAVRVVSGPPRLPPQPVSYPQIAATEPRRDTGTLPHLEAEAAREGDGYPYWDGRDPGVWGMDADYAAPE